MTNKVLHIGFGLRPFWGGGMIVYQESLMKMIVNSGWNVSFLTVAPRCNLFFKPYVKISIKDKIRTLEIVNPPALPSDCHINPDKHCKNVIIESILNKVIEREKPEIVHLHDLRPYPASIIDGIFNRKIPMIKTVNNYWDICPQGDLIFRGEKICTNFEEGNSCVDCLSAFPKDKATFKQRIVGTILNTPIYSVSRALWNFGKIKQNKVLKKEDVRIPYTALAYKRRRQFFVEQLNKINIIHVSSHRVADILEHYGVYRSRIKIIPLSSQTLDLITPKPLRDNKYPVIFGYCGGANHHKGFDILLEAFSRLDQKKAKLIIFETERFKSIFKKDILNIEIRKRYAPSEINQSLSDIDIGLVPSVWEEVFGIIGIEFLQARIPVIGSKIGGIPEWLKDGENGFFVSPADTNDLSEKMQRFIDNPSLIARFQIRIQPWKSMKEHTQEITNLYNNVLQNHTH